MDAFDLAEAAVGWLPTAGASLFANLAGIALVVLGLALWATQGLALVGGALVAAGLAVLVIAELRWLLGRSQR